MKKISENQSSSRKSYTPPTFALSESTSCRPLAASVILSYRTMLFMAHQKGEDYDFESPEFNHSWTEGEE